MSFVAFAGAIAFIFAAVWSGLVSFDIVTPAAPPLGEGGEPELKAYWGWFAGILPALQLGYIVLIVALASLALANVGLAILRQPRNPAVSANVTVAAGAVVTGCLLWIIGACERLGGDRAVALLATHDNPIEPTNSIAFAADWTATAFELTGSLMAGAGLIALGYATRAHRKLALAAGTALAALGIAQYADLSEWSTWLRLATGGVLLPWWLIAAGLALRTHTHQPGHADR